MARAHTIQTDFSAGEVSPRLHSRIDIANYKRATKTLENAYVTPHGGVRRRQGTVFLGAVSNSSKPVKLLPFVYSKALAYTLVLNDSKIQFLTNATFILNGGPRYEIAHPYTDNELDDLRYAQSGNTLYIVHPNHPPKLIQRNTDTNWTLSDIGFINGAVTDYTYENAYITFRIISSTTQFEIGNYFTIITNGIGGISSITGPTIGSASAVGNGAISAVDLVDLDAPAETWTITCTYADSVRQEWSVVGSVSGSMTALWKTGDYPQTVSFHEQRLFFGGSPSNPQTVWASASGDYFNFRLGPLDSDALEYKIASNTYDDITHMQSARELLIMTYAAEFSMAGPNSSAISSSNAAVKAHTFHGANFVRPMRIGKEVVFVDRAGTKVRSITYSITEDANIAPDLTVFSEHITESGLIDFAYADNPDQIAWGVRNDGTAVTLTLYRDYEVVAWCRQITQGEFEQVEIIPTPVQDSVYFVVKRTVNGSTVRYIESLHPENILFVDCAMYLEDATAKTTWSGLDHLEGLEVGVLADGVVHPSLTVTNGTIELQYLANNVVVGLEYTTKVELLNPEFGDAANTSQGRQMSINKVILRFHAAKHCIVNNQEIIFRKTTDLLGEPIPLYQGDKELTRLGWGTQDTISITTDLPHEWHLLAVIIKALVNE